MSSQPTTDISLEEYLARERQDERKSEYVRGASGPHVWIVANVSAELRQQLKGKPCRVSSSDLRLRVTSADLYTYPDVMVVCGEPEFADDRKDTLLNPILIIEVVSNSTRDYDRGRKFQYSRTLPSLMEYLTIDQDVPHVEHYTRLPENHWDLVDYDGLAQSIQLTSIGCVLPLAEAYDKIEW